MGIEPTPRAAEARGNGFEDRESHQAPRASGEKSITRPPRQRRGDDRAAARLAALAASVPIRVALLALLVALAYGEALAAGVAWDDIYLLSGNPAIRSLARPWRFFTDPWTMAPSGGVFLFQFRPLRTLLFALQFAVFDGNAWGYHLCSIALFAVAAWLVGSLTEALFGRGRWLATTIWLLHPALAENVVSLSAQANLLCLDFSLAALVAHLRWLDRRSPWSRAGSLAALAAAVVSYEVGAIVPLLIAGVELVRWLGGRTPPLSAVRRHVPLWIVVGCVLGARAMVVEPIPPTEWWGGSWSQAFVLQLRVWLEGLRLSLLPVGQHVRYLPGDIPAFASAPAALLVQLGIAAFVVWSFIAGKGRLPAVCAVWWYVAQAPTCNFLVPTIGYLFAPRFLFLALVLPVAAFAAWLVPRMDSRAVRVAAVVAALAAVPLIRHEVRVWQTPISLNREIIATNPNDYAGHCLLGWSYVLYGDGANARSELDIAARLSPSASVPHFLLGEVLMRDGDMKAAHTAFNTAIALKGMFIEPTLRLAEITVYVGQPHAARAWLATLGAIEGFNPFVRARLELTRARVELALGDRGKVPERVNRALETSTETADVLFEAGVLLAYCGERERGRELLRRACVQAGRDYTAMVGGERRGDLALLRPLLPLTPPGRFASFSVPVVGP
jgi:protein O-mannosyl-transferase